MSQEPDVELDKKDMKAFTKKLNALWLKREDRNGLLEYIQMAEELAHAKQRTQEDLVKLARAYFIQAEYFAENSKERIALWEKSSNWSEKALTFNSAFKEKVVTQKLPTDLALDVLTKKDQDALYWFSCALGKWASDKGLPTVLKYKDRIKKMIDRVSSLDPHYFYGAVYRYNGVYYASLPGINSEDMKASKNQFEKALKRAPEYFANHVLFAEFYAKKIDDMRLFKKHLEIVINGNPKTIKDFYPEQILEQHRAKKLLEEMSKP